MARSARREPTSFWRENVTAVVILLRVLTRMSLRRKCDAMRSGEGSNSFNKNNRSNFLVKKCNKIFRDYYFLRRGKKTSESSMLTNLKISVLELLPAKEIPA